VRYQKTGAGRATYLSILATYTVRPLSIVILNRKARFDKHRRIARWTLPISLRGVTGVVVYMMLYRL
jgi:putative membrane protein